jgi:hypothetical protein
MGIIKHDPAAGRWSAAPNELIERSDLSIEARFFVIWCLAKPPSWQLRVSHIQRSLGWGEHKWLRIANELKNTGHLSYERLHSSTGLFTQNLLVRPIPFQPHPGQPGVVERGMVEPCMDHPRPVDAGDYVRPTKTRREENNNNQPARTREVVVSNFFIEQNLLEPRELNELKEAAVLSASADPQALLDEVCGQIRHKGRLGERGIKHPVRLLKRISTSSSLDFAADERERRETKMRPIALRSNLPQKESQGVPCPPHLSSRIAALVGGKHDN